MGHENRVAGTSIESLLDVAAIKPINIHVCAQLLQIRSWKSQRRRARSGKYLVYLCW